MEDTKDKPITTPLSNQPINPEDKWILGINLSISTPAEITQFIRWKIRTYKEFGWKGDELGELYEMDVDQFRAEDFERCEHNTQVLLRNVLRSQGLYIKKGRGIKIARELAHAIHTETKWPDDPEKPIPSRTNTPIHQDPPYDQAWRLAAEQSRSQPRQPEDRSCRPEDQVIDALARMEMSGHGRELMTIAKSYTNDNHNPTKYSVKAFPTMLTGIALEFYYTNCRGKYHVLNEPFAVFKNYFEGDEHKRNKLSEWNGINLRTAIQKKPNEPIAETFRTMVQQLQPPIHVSRPIRTLQRAGHNDPSHRGILEHITKFCSFCQRHRRSPDRFKFTWKSRRRRRRYKRPTVLCIDSKSLYDCLVKLGITQEKRLMVDLMCLRQSYERREITEIIWIKGPTNPADAMTKEKPCPALRRIIDSNKIEVDVDGWVERMD
ncbi:MAG: Transposon Ty2-OR1 Gag-Pol poly [Lasallia pustulata]|uniref:Transposon Ty2-OR1 Gag-Pol poly n=1 Tax=Lasallia pustulata TaxID=136370 RepID=A0A5M8PMW7_9LECA|nr:MAG: Transposon Ty2-OR1 Gag-Pol poly [Lasallia pustulata]